MTTGQQTKVKGVVDIVFLLDVSGSMQPCIDALKENIHAFIVSLTTKDANNSSPVKEWRAKAVGFRDFAVDRATAFVDHPFVDSESALRSQLAALRAEGGGDEPESLLEALYLVATMPEGESGAAVLPEKWRHRRDAVRTVIVFSDASFKHELVEPKGATLSDVQNTLMSNRIVLTIFAPDLDCYSGLAAVDKCQYEPVSGGATPQESLAKFTADKEHFQEIMRQLGKTLSKTVSATPL